MMAEPLLEILSKVIRSHNTVMQVQLLGLLRIVMSKSHAPGPSTHELAQRLGKRADNIEKEEREKAKEKPKELPPLPRQGKEAHLRSAPHREI